MTTVAPRTTDYVEELRDEQAVADRAYALLEARLDAADGAHLAAADGRAAQLLRERAAQLRAEGLEDEGLLVGRLDEEDDGVLRIGRRLVRDEHGDVLVCNWQADAAAPFYRATPRRPLGVRRRRTYQCVERLLTGFSDEWLAPGDRPDGMVSAPQSGTESGLRGHDVLLDDLQRSRDGRMRDIVATIQADQYDLITEPAEGVLVVQGGPGSGKTAVALHRASYLLFDDPRLKDQGLLLLGPNEAFMAYVADVLPGLDTSAVTQWAMTDLVGAPTGEPDAVERDSVLGDARWVQVLDRLVRSSRNVLPKPVVVSLPGHDIVVSLPRQLAALRAVEAGRTTHNAGAEALRQTLVRSVVNEYYDRAGRVASSHLDVDALVRQDKGLRRACRNIWPEQTAEGLLAALLSDLAFLVATTDGVFTDAELVAVWRPELADETEEAGTTWGELFLLDELRQLLDGTPQQFGHIVVDEAQELLPMALRAVARRLQPGAGATVLGDLAQAAAGRRVEDWQHVLDVLDRAPARVQTLRRGYRVPAEVLDAANRLLPLTESGQEPTTSIRSVPDSLRHDMVPDLEWGVLEAVLRLHEAGGSVAVVVSRGGLDDFPASDLLPDGVQVHDALTVKGLEFDAVVVVEPEDFLASGAPGARDLYVAMTRCTRSLTLVHALPLPQVLTQESAQLVQALPAAAQPPAHTPPPPASPTSGVSSEPLPPERAMKHLLEAIAVLAQRQGLPLSGDEFLEFRSSPLVHQQALELLDPSLRARVVAALS